jgi:hypothetical protein
VRVQAENVLVLGVQFASDDKFQAKSIFHPMPDTPRANPLVRATTVALRPTTRFTPSTCGDSESSRARTPDIVRQNHGTHPSKYEGR